MAGPLYRELVRILRPGKGSHEIWFSPVTKHHFVVPFDVAKRATVNAILRQAGLAKAF